MARRGGGGIPGRDPFERFREKYVINHQTGCFEWTGALNSKGYGAFGYGGKGKTVLAHRWAIEHVGGTPIPPGMQADHMCNNRRCVNVAHLRVVTNRDNTLAAHSNSPSGVNSRRTHCVQGHEYTPENTIHKKRGTRECRECRLVAWRKKHPKNVEAQL